MSTTQELTEKERLTNEDTRSHIMQVNRNIHKMIVELINRGDIHDASKLERPEVTGLSEKNDDLPQLSYQSPEYIKNRNDLASTLTHHYARNRHHPEHWKNGVSDMNIIDLVEMLSDWAASAIRHNDGNLRKSIEANAVRFNINPQLAKILENSIDLFS